MVQRSRSCPTCHRPIPEPLTRCRRRACASYSDLWAGDQRRKLFVNLQGYERQVPVDCKPQVLIGSVTAPGTRPTWNPETGEVYCEGLPWDEAHCAYRGPHRHDGRQGCRVNPVAAREWNDSAPDRWRALHRAAGQVVKRQGHRVWMLARVWEEQHRRVLHVHPVLAYSTPAERVGARAYLKALEQLAQPYGFGYIERKTEVRQANAAAGYLSSYFVTGKGKKRTLQESVKSPAMPRSIVHVSHELTRSTGCTMRRLRMVRFLHVRGWAGLCDGDTFHEVDRYEGSPTGGIRRRVAEAPCAAP